MRKTVLLTALFCICAVSSGCASFGAKRLRADQVDYARALGDAKKREILSEVVGLRYADPPGFLSVTQIIAAYQFDAGSGATVNAGPGVQSYSPLIGTATASYSNHPTFTFTPTTGEALATAYIHPLPATLLLPLAESGVPIDLLLRLTVQSIAGLQNASLLGGPNSDGSSGFFQLIQALRRLQQAGELTVGYTAQATDADGKKAPHATPEANQSAANTPAVVSLILSATAGGESAQTRADLQLVRRLLHLSEKTHTYPVVYGQSASNTDQIPMVTRSVLGILGDLGAQVNVPDQDIVSGATKPTIGLVGGENRPTVIVHSGPKAPKEAFVAIQYRGHAYWVDADDFDSKYALGIVQEIVALAQADQNTAPPVVTVPAG